MPADDDDAWDWGDDSSAMECVDGDSWTCVHTNMTEIEAAVCGHTCNATDEKRIRELAHNSSLTLDEVGGMVGHSYLAVCEWEAVKHLPLLCNGSFAGRYGGYGYLPDTPSNNLWPNAVNVPATLMLGSCAGSTCWFCGKCLYLADSRWRMNGCSCASSNRMAGCRDACFSASGQLLRDTTHTQS